MALRTITTLAAACVVVACGELAQQPSLTRSGVPLAMAVAWPEEARANAVFGADIDHVRIGVYRQNEATAVDTVIAWRADDEEFRLGVDVPLIEREETLYVYLDLMVGQQTYWYGSQQIVLRDEVVPPTPVFELYYYGPGYDAAFLTIGPRTAFVQTGGTLQMTANVQNGQGQVVSPPLGWSVSDTRLATISASGLLTARSQTGSVWARVAIPTGLVDSVQVSIGSGQQSP